MSFSLEPYNKVLSRNYQRSLSFLDAENTMKQEGRNKFLDDHSTLTRVYTEDLSLLLEKGVTCDQISTFLVDLYSLAKKVSQAGPLTLENSHTNNSFQCPFKDIIIDNVWILSITDARTSKTLYISTETIHLMDYHSFFRKESCHFPFTLSIFFEIFPKTPYPNLNSNMLTVEEEEKDEWIDLYSPQVRLTEYCEQATKTRK